VARNVGYPLKMRKVPRVESDRRVEAALAGVEMESMADRLPHQISGGQRQRVALARALVGRPKVLLLDEPLGALDLHLRQQMQTMLKQLQRDVGITFVYVTHDQGEALSMSDRLAVMNQGRIEQVGQPRDVYHRPATRFVAGFIGKTNLLTLDVRDGTTTLAGRRFPVPAAPTSGSTTFSLRHEAVRVGGRPQGDGWVELSGVVAEVSFLGDSQEVAVVVDGQVIVAREAATTSESLGHGSTTTLTFRPADLVAVGD
jgi:spermidine/putrescine transport system ATP-binding protein